MLQPSPEPAAEQADGAASEAETAKPEKAAAPTPKVEIDEEGTPSFEYVELEQQFVVPVVRNEVVQSVVVMAISLEVDTGTSGTVFSVQPRLRDSFLQAMFDHAAIGGFDGSFANNQNLNRLRFALKEKAYATLGDRVNDVLITDIVRQDM